MGARFAWDEGKAERNLGKHGVSFAEATAFADPLSLTIADPDHSEAEERWITVGETLRRRLVVVVHIDAEDLIRIVSAREANRQERKVYEEGTR